MGYLTDLASMERPPRGDKIIFFWLTYLLANNRSDSAGWWRGF